MPPPLVLLSPWSHSRAECLPLGLKAWNAPMRFLPRARAMLSERSCQLRLTTSLSQGICILIYSNQRCPEWPLSHVIWRFRANEVQLRDASGHKPSEANVLRHARLCDSLGSCKRHAPTGFGPRLREEHRSASLFFNSAAQASFACRS